MLLGCVVLFFCFIFNIIIFIESHTEHDYDECVCTVRYDTIRYGDTVRSGVRCRAVPVGQSVNVNMNLNGARAFHSFRHRHLIRRHNYLLLFNW